MPALEAIASVPKNGLILYGDHCDGRQTRVHKSKSKLNHREVLGIIDWLLSRYAQVKTSKSEVLTQVKWRKIPRRLDPT
jgi:hypothetical protein